ncbi:MAG: WYL domain-containing protein [bacterium]
MALHDQFLRRWRLLRALEGGGSWSAEELLDLLSSEGAREEGEGGGRLWSLRTLRRDLAHLIQAGFPLEGVRKGRKMRYLLDEGFLHSTPAPFRPSQWAALYYALSILRESPESPLREGPLGPSVSGVFARMRDFVPAALRAYAEGVEPRYAGVVGGLREQGRQRRVGESLRKAIADSRPVRLLAARPGELRRRWIRVDPYLLRYAEGGFHLLGREGARGTLEAWPLAGIESVRVERGAFQLPLGLDLGAALAERLREMRGAGLDVRIRLAQGASGAAVAAFLDEAFGPARLVRGGGRGAAEVAVKVGDVNGFRRWLLAFGAEAEALSPRELRESVAQELEDALKRYRRGRKRAG